MCGTLASVLCVGLLLVVLVKIYGVSLEGSARLLLDLALWSVSALQTVSQAAPASAAALQFVLSTLFRGVAVLQLDGVLAPAGMHRGVCLSEPGVFIVGMLFTRCIPLLG